MLHLILSMTLIASPLADTTARKEEACNDTAQAKHLCHTAYQLWDLTQRMDRELDVCKSTTFTLQKKLETMTATTTVHTKVIEVERQLTPLEKVFEYVGVATVFLGGFALGWVVFH